MGEGGGTTGTQSKFQQGFNAANTALATMGTSVQVDFRLELVIFLINVLNK